MNAYRPARRGLVPILLAAAVAAACTPTVPSAATHPPIRTAGPRPASDATVEIVEPKQSAVIAGDTIHVVLRLEGGTIVPETSTDLRPDQGHVHLYVNDVLVSMNYGLEQDIPAQPGSTVLRAEFVAADHAPFNPRVWSPEVVFTVAG